jgi:capsule polysaccharide export protein KpsE/RkpR
MGNSDAINVDIYPDVLTSYDFIAELMPVQVKSQDGGINTNYYTYLRDHQRYAWWTQLMGMMHELFEPAQETPTYSGDQKLSVFNLNRKQQYIFMEARSKITCKIDKKTGIVTIMVKDLDPLIAATMAKATCKKLQEFITKYRTNKARVDFEYYQKLATEAKADYETALKKYAASADAHTNTVLATYQAKVESLENDMQAKYNIYTAMNTQMQAAAAKLQEATPAFTVIEGASIPLKPAGPKRMIISILMAILAGMVLTGRLLMKG